MIQSSLRDARSCLTAFQALKRLAKFKPPRRGVTTLNPSRRYAASPRHRTLLYSFFTFRMSLASYP
jgi:hypothetical protein